MWASFTGRKEDDGTAFAPSRIIRCKVREKKRTNSGPLRKSTDKHSIYPRHPDAGTYRTDLVQQVLEELQRQGLDTQGLSFTKHTVQITQGGE